VGLRIRGGGKVVFPAESYLWPYHDGGVKCCGEEKKEEFQRKKGKGGDFRGVKKNEKKENEIKQKPGNGQIADKIKRERKNRRSNPI